MNTLCGGNWMEMCWVIGREVVEVKVEVVLASRGTGVWRT